MVDNVINEIKDEVKSLTNSMNVFEKSFNGMVDEVENLDSNLNEVFSEVKDFSGTIDEKFVTTIKKFFNQLIGKILDPDTFASVLMKFFKIIWSMMKKIFNLLYKKYPEFRLLVLGGLIFITLPFLGLISSQITVMQLFLPASVILIFFIVVTVLLYFNIWSVWMFIINYIVNTIAKVDWKDITKDIINELGDLIKEIIQKMVK